mgnify:CR=1 FL=1
MTVKLNIGYVATAIAPYYSNEYKVRENSEIALKKLLSNFDVNFIPFHKTIFSEEDAVEAEKFFKNNTVGSDFIYSNYNFLLEDFSFTQYSKNCSSLAKNFIKQENDL